MGASKIVHLRRQNLTQKVDDSFLTSTWTSERLIDSQSTLFYTKNEPRHDVGGIHTYLDAPWYVGAGYGWWLTIRKPWSSLVAQMSDKFGYWYSWTVFETLPTNTTAYQLGQYKHSSLPTKELYSYISHHTIPMFWLPYWVSWHRCYFQSSFYCF